MKIKNRTKGIISFSNGERLIALEANTTNELSKEDFETVINHPSFKNFASTSSLQIISDEEAAIEKKIAEEKDEDSVESVLAELSDEASSENVEVEIKKNKKKNK